MRVGRTMSAAAFLRSHNEVLHFNPFRRRMAVVQKMILRRGSAVASEKSTAPMLSFRHLRSAWSIHLADRASMVLSWSF